MPQVQLWRRGRQKYRNNRQKCYSICPPGGSLPNKDFEKWYRQHRLAGRQRHSDNYCCIRLMVGLHHERYCLVPLKIMVCVVLCIFQDQMDRPDAIKMVRYHFLTDRNQHWSIAYVASHGTKDPNMDVLKCQNWTVFSKKSIGAENKNLFRTDPRSVSLRKDRPFWTVQKFLWVNCIWFPVIITVIVFIRKLGIIKTY